MHKFANARCIKRNIQGLERAAIQIYLIVNLLEPQRNRMLLWRTTSKSYQHHLIAGGSIALVANVSANRMLRNCSKPYDAEQTVLQCLSERESNADTGTSVTLAMTDSAAPCGKPPLLGRLQPMFFVDGPGCIT